jgi:undecaprenyl-diphosphatase
MRVLERASAWPFVIYRALLGVLLLGGAAAGLLR